MFKSFTLSVQVPRTRGEQEIQEIYPLCFGEVRHGFFTSPHQSRLFLPLVQHSVLASCTAWSFEIRTSKDSVEEEVARTGKSLQKKVNKNVEYLKSD